MLSLVMNPGTPEEASFALSTGTLTVGRTEDNQIVCTHKSLSRRHAQIDFDGRTVRVTDLQSKNGVFVNGVRVPSCELEFGDTFRCGDIPFLIDDGSPRNMLAGAQTLPSPFIDNVSIRRRVPNVGPAVTIAEDQRYKDKLFLLIRASELLVGQAPTDRILDELVALAGQVLDVDRIVLLTFDPESRAIAPRVTKSFVPPQTRAYSRRVVDWVASHGSSTSFANVSHDRMLEGDAEEDAAIRSAMAVPINPGGRPLGVLYADNLAASDVFRPDDLALMRALANLAALAIQRGGLLSSESIVAN